MKRFLAMIVALCSILVAMAQHPMATLSHDGELTQFTGIGALDNALDSSNVGDIIYLSEGTFSSHRDSSGIKYGVSVIGCGYNSKVLGTIVVWMNDDNRDITMNTPWLEGVNVERLNFGDEANFGNNREYLEIRNCLIGELSWAGHAAKNSYFNGCYIKEADFSGINQEGIKTAYLANCKIEYLRSGAEYVIAKNCNIKITSGCPRIVESSIIESSDHEDGKLGTYGWGTHIINNSLFPSEVLLSDAYSDNLPQNGVDIKHCYFENPANGLLDENLNATIDLQAKGYLGQDGTVIGAYGGENPFSEYPSVPTIDSEKSSVEFDPASNKLNVTITVASN